MVRDQNGNEIVSYIDGKNKPVKNRPNPRTISNALGPQTLLPPQRNRLGLTNIFTFFGQWVDHDTVLTHEQTETQSGFTNKERKERRKAIKKFRKCVKKGKEDCTPVPGLPDNDFDI